MQEAQNIPKKRDQSLERYVSRKTPYNIPVLEQATNCLRAEVPIAAGRAKLVSYTHVSRKDFGRAVRVTQAKVLIEREHVAVTRIAFKNDFNGVAEQHKTDVHK
jgi:hypothetical protein